MRIVLNDCGTRSWVLLRRWVSVEILGYALQQLTENGALALIEPRHDLAIDGCSTPAACANSVCERRRDGGFPS
jgi:hypothetical protein